MKKYLLEIGTEELPYKFIPSAQKQIGDAFSKLLKDNNISFDKITTQATPRRIVIVVDNISEKQPDVSKEVKGPILNIAYKDDGELSPAGLGFAKKNNISPENLFKKDNYIWAKIEEKGKTIQEILQNNVPEIVLKMQGPHFMRWADLDVKFQRPIRWIVSLLGEEEIKITIADVESSRFSRGHRFSKTSVEIKSPDEYVHALYNANVIVESSKRKEIIVQSATKKANEIGAEIVFDEELLEEVANITEWPVPVLCEFDESYLKIPEKVTVTVMATHQRYFPLYKDGKLLNNFITMANYVGDDFSNIKAGNERVIKARLDDAKFFFHEDNKIKLVDYLEKLKGVTFQNGMGSMYDKTYRIIELSKYIKENLCLTSDKIDRTALLCKCDLVTSLVFEFTELQGFIGADYAELNGEDYEVADGIKEHYYPLNAESELASTQTGIVVGIADKIDTISAVFASGKKPTGSADPLGVRRATLGILKTILLKPEYNIDLLKLIQKSVDILPVQIDDKAKLVADIVEFFEQRLVIYLADSYKNDVINACLSGKSVLADLKDFMIRLNIIAGLVKTTEYAKLHESVNRVLRILKDTFSERLPEFDLFNTDEERNLFNYFKDIDENSLSYDELIAKLSGSEKVISEFFDKVLVMDNDEQIKNNRIALLCVVKNKFVRLADFSKIVL